MYGPFYYVHYERGESGCVPIHYVERSLAEPGELESIHAVIFTLIQSSAVEYFHGNNKFRTNCVTCTPHAIFALSYLHYNINPTTHLILSALVFSLMFTVLESEKHTTALKSASIFLCLLSLGVGTAGIFKRLKRLQAVATLLLETTTTRMASRRRLCQGEQQILSEVLCRLNQTPGHRVAEGERNWLLIHSCSYRAWTIYDTCPSSGLFVQRFWGPLCS